MSDSKSELSVNEIVASLKRSFLPTLLIEGKDDVYIYRWLKKQLGNKAVTLQPVGGRGKLFQVHDRLKEFNDKNVVFIADQDLYKFSGIPKDRKDIIFTTGYSIENDVYAGSDIVEFMEEDEVEKHQVLVNVLTKWFAFEVEKHCEAAKKGTLARHSFKSHVREITSNCRTDICEDFCQKINFSMPSDEFLELISSAQALNIRGKQLFQALSIVLSDKQRFAKFNEKQLIEVALKTSFNTNTYMKSLTSQIQSSLAAP